MMTQTMESMEFKNKGSRYFFHAGLGENVFNRKAVAEILGCTVSNLCRLRKIGGLRSLAARYNREVVYAESDIKAYLEKRK